MEAPGNPGFDGTSWHDLAAWQIGHNEPSNEDQPASFLDFRKLHHAVYDNHCLQEVREQK